MTEKKNNKELEKEIKPLFDRVFCRCIENKENMIGGIIIPDQAQKKPREAIVVAVGDGHMTPEGKMVPLKIAPGMKVLLSEYGGTEEKIGDAEYRIVNEKDILAVIGVIEAPESEKE